MNQLQSALKYLPGIDSLPLILAGPILRHTAPERVTVWLALKAKRSLSLKIYETQNQGTIIGETVFQGQGTTVQLGKHLHLAVITAQAETGILLQAGKIYAYNVFCYGDQANEQSLAPYSLINDLSYSDYSLSYFPHQLPTFSLPPEDLNHLNIIHGSCRKPHGGGRDALSCLDNLIQERAALANHRPHQLFLTGDQIYGDDVADPILWLAQGINNLLFDWSEELPLKEGTILAAEVPPGNRSNLARIEGGFTAMLSGNDHKAKSHLFSFGEYAAAYLLAWSPVFMPKYFPAGKSLFSDSRQSRHWEQETEATTSFVTSLDRVRRALANVPVYTICDDHDISDDWYLNREWCNRVLGKPLGKRVVQNGLLAYALFQAWGNTPERFAAGTAGEELLQLASQWLISKGQDFWAKTQCDRYLGIPLTDTSTGLPQLEEDEDVLILSRDSQAIPWHYTISNSKHEVIVLDTRTWRGYPAGEDQAIEPPMLLSPRAFREQLHLPLSQSEPEIEATIVVLPTNLVTLNIIDRIQQFELSRNRVFSTDVGDSWNFHQEAFASLLLTLGQHRQRVIILSGDIHYSCAVRLIYYSQASKQTSVLVQLTSSAIKNSEPITRLIHTKLKSLLPEKSEHWLGWNQPLKLKKLIKSNLTIQEPLPDWQYFIEWCRRQPLQSLSWQRPLSNSNRQLSLWQKLTAGLIYLFWRNRWLQEGLEVVGRNNLSLVRFQWSTTKTVIQETYWHPPWNKMITVKSSYQASLESEPLPALRRR